MRVLALFIIVAFQCGFSFKPSGKLEIHYINVGQGGCTLIIGPNGTKILYDFGNVDGRLDIVPYLESIGVGTDVPIEYAILSHRDQDHFFGYKGLIEAGYNVTIKNYDSGSGKISPRIRSHWLTPGKNTEAGRAVPIKVGEEVALGDGARLIAVAANGKILGKRRHIKVKNENDKSVALFITYGDFQYILDGDLGGGRESCTHHQTEQLNVQMSVANALLKKGLITRENGVDVMHVSHHGSESSTPASYYNVMKPEVGIISVGIHQDDKFAHPRSDVVDSVLLGESRPSCVEAPPLKELFQTEDGEINKTGKGRTSNAGSSIGDIVLKTNGRTGYTIKGTFRFHGHSDNPDRHLWKRKYWKFYFDEL